MTYIIGMVSQKGGVGKSTLARMMAREFVAGGLATKIADLDTQQQTCTHWAGRRAESGVTPEIQVQSFAAVKTALEDAPRFDALILDGKPERLGANRRDRQGERSCRDPDRPDGR